MIGKSGRRTPRSALGVMTLMMISAVGATGCGDPVTCWCRCPSGSSVEYTQTTSDKTCNEICQDYGCYYEESSGCSPGTTQGCTCEGGLIGTRTCSSDGVWSDCLNCASQPVCTEGDQDICICDNGEAGWQYCEGGAWGACTECDVGETSGVVIADIDWGNEGMTQGGVYQDVFDSVEWGCPGMASDEDTAAVDSLIWRIFPRDAAHPEGIWFEFDLPAGLTSVQSEYWEMSLTGDGGALSQMELIINGTIVQDGFEATAGCVHRVELEHPLDLFIAGGRNRIEAWSAVNGSGVNHGLQGIWIRFEYQN